MLKKFWKLILKNVFNSVPFKKLELPIHPFMNMPKTDSTAIVSFVCSEKLQNSWRASVVESRFSKVRETSAF